MKKYKVKYDDIMFFETIVDAYGVADAYWKGIEKVRGWVGISVTEIEWIEE